jgi:hypothetical protein
MVINNKNYIIKIMFYRQINKLVNLYKIEIGISCVSVINLLLIIPWNIIENKNKVGDKIIYDEQDRLIRIEGSNNHYIVDNNIK